MPSHPSAADPVAADPAVPDPAVPDPAVAERAVPPVAVRADGALSAEEVRERLAAGSPERRRERLARLGIVGADAEELLPLAVAAAADAEILAEITATAALLGAGAGLDVPAVDLEARAAHHDALQRRLAPGEGLIPILALTVSTGTVERWHAARGLSPVQSDRVLADLGQQMRVHRAGTGRLGLHQRNWVSGNWAGRLVHLGRLQFDLHRRRIVELEGGDAAARPSADGQVASSADGEVASSADGRERWVVGVHIPATGPLDPGAVDASLDEAAAHFGAHYADLDAGRGPQEPRIGHELVCDSWLLSEELAEIAGAESNLARFAARWEPMERARMDDAALFFVFGLRPPVDLAALPRRTRLERGVAERLSDGRGWTGGTGRLVR